MAMDDNDDDGTILLLEMRRMNAPFSMFEKMTPAQPKCIFVVVSNGEMTKGK